MAQYFDLQALNQQIHLESGFVEQLKAETSKVIVGQEQIDVYKRQVL